MPDAAAIVLASCAIRQLFRVHPPPARRSAGAGHVRELVDRQPVGVDEPLER
jgi:hypothetical protein